MADTAIPGADYPIAPPIPATPAIPAMPAMPPVSAEAPPAEAEEQVTPITDFPLIGGGLNPIIDEYNELIALAIQLQNVEQHENTDALYAKVNQQIMQIDHQLKQGFNYSDTLLNACRYAVCCLLDEMVLDKAWSEDTQWQQVSLVENHFANTLSAHKFYNVLKRLLLNPVKYREAIETFYLCLLLGFQGTTQDAKDDLPGRENMIEQTRQALEYFWQPSKDKLSQHEKYLNAKKYQIDVDLPIWAISLITLLTLLILYWVLRSSLDTDIAIIIEQLDQLGRGR